MHLSGEQLNKLNCIYNRPECNMTTQSGVPCFPETIPPILPSSTNIRPFTEYENQRAQWCQLLQVVVALLRKCQLRFWKTEQTL